MTDKLTDFPHKIYVLLDPNPEAPFPEILAVRDPKEHATPYGQVLAEYVLNKCIKATLVTTETLTVEDVE